MKASKKEYLDAINQMKKMRFHERKAIRMAKEFGNKMRKTFRTKPYTRKIMKKHHPYLKQRDPNGFDTIPVSKGVGAFLNFFVHEEWKGDNSGEFMAIEDALEYFWGQQIERYISTIEALWFLLKENRMTVRNKFERYGSDSYAWYEPCREPEESYISYRKAFVLQSQSGKQLVIIEKSGMSYKIHVRKIHDRTVLLYDWNYVEKASITWYRKNNFKCEYGDCRDKDYVLTYESPPMIEFVDKKTKEKINPEFGGVDRAYGYHYSITHFIYTLQMTYQELKLMLDEKESNSE